MSESESKNGNININIPLMISRKIISFLVFNRSIKVPAQKFVHKAATGESIYRMEMANGDPVISRIIKFKAIK